MIVQPVILTIPASASISQTVAVQAREYNNLVSIVTNNQANYDIEIYEEGSNRILCRFPSQFSNLSELFLREKFRGLNLIINLYNNTAQQISRGYVGLKLATDRELGLEVKPGSFNTPATSQASRMR